MVHSLLEKAAPLLRRGEGASRFWSHDRTVTVDTLRGACVAMRMKAVKQVGPLASSVDAFQQLEANPSAIIEAEKF